MGERCECPLDWVACFSSACPRAKAIRDEQERRARDFVLRSDPTPANRGGDG